PSRNGGSTTSLQIKQPAGDAGKDRRKTKNAPRPKKGTNSAPERDLGDYGTPPA
ncbi:MAG TPA: hypothetical protein GXX48_23080, partial [Ochrobactrum intermedium]|nr:hypothetical protein [Brucella intermedia]